jgi:opacity protein-like surface antigen
VAAWLDAAQAATLVEQDDEVAASEAWVASFDAAAAWVEKQRSDLFAGEPPVFGADAAVKLGTAMLANRWYARRKSPLGSTSNAEFGAAELMRHDPDVAKMLGIGVDGKFVFGAPTTVRPGEVVL